MMTFILSICGIVIIMVLACFIAKHYTHKDTTMSFRETMDLVGLPIVTFRNGDKKFNFLLDTGASDSVINSSVLPELECTILKDKTYMYGMEGNTVESDLVFITLYYKEKQYNDTFRAINMDAAFGQLKHDFGVNVHGILSSSFFERYKYVLDFKDLIAYSKQ